MFGLPMGVFIALVFVALFLLNWIKILNEYERGVIFRLGKYLKTKGPGLIFIIPLIDKPRKVDIRLVSIDVPRQEVMTRDNVPATIDAVVYFKIVDPATALIVIQQIYLEIADALHSKTDEGKSQILS